MSSLFADVLARLHVEHDLLGGLAGSLTDERLIGPSAASEWRVCDVFSHLGSGAEIGERQVTTALGQPSTDADNEAIWGRWNGMAPADQMNGYLTANRAYLDTLDALTDEQQRSLQIDMGFMPQPVPLIMPIGLRLNEVVLHGWDIAAGSDDAAEVTDASATVLLDLLAGPLSSVLGFTAKPAELGRDARIALPGYTLHVFGASEDAAESVSIEQGEPKTADANFEGTVGAVVRLLAGRLKPPYDDGVRLVGDLDLDDLRKVFPGY